ncbi:hypothetical protein FPSE_07375 [Fusarium pseudograminearum CS3096]|uniref:Uncharacterized protein n=1 Tax=Fusarium pseudograminearum (strain CS3096) TaxID=1028729 RepID=K3VEZ9_FUSPC|nr:hypothetical protein FPSE_07375 [Fusarium pseudograminearum CS3096]EKJ72494.1 hypothetical protein FPSE_07375 [Fusarium pseudograminearum CS3096]
MTQNLFHLDSGYEEALKKHRGSSQLGKESGSDHRRWYQHGGGEHPGLSFQGLRNVYGQPRPPHA